MSAESVNRLLQPLATQKDYEIELRLRSFNPKKIKNNYSSSVSVKEFYRILSHFQTTGDYRLTTDPRVTETEKYLNVELSNSPQVIVEANFQADRNKTIRESWVESQSIVPVFYSSKVSNIPPVDLPDYLIRIAKAKETPIATVFPDQPQEIIGESLRKVGPRAYRRKERWSFLGISEESPLGDYRADLTKVTGWSVDYKGERKSFTSHEVELESIGLLRDYQEDIYPAIKYIMGVRQASNFPIPFPTMQSVYRSFNELLPETFGKDYFSNKKMSNPVVKPVNIKKQILTFPQNLAITDKADGERKLLLIRVDGAFLVYPEHDVSKFLTTTPGSEYSVDQGLLSEYSGSLLDGEFINQTDYYAFDLLVLNGEDIRSKPFSERLELLKKIVGLPHFHVKTFSTPGENFYKRVNSILDSIGDKNYDNDGLIFNESDDDYSKRSRVYKWKPPGMLTIDFMLQATTVQGVFMLLLKNDRSRDAKYIPLNNPKTNQPFVFSSTEFKDKQIVELRWNFSENEWELFRVRHDREQPNNFSTAESIWRDIQDPITEKTIRGLDLIPMRKVHNQVKKAMLERCSGQNLLDIGSGKGGDILKWKEWQINVFVVEPSEENISELHNRLIFYGGIQQPDSSFTLGNNKVMLLQTGGEDTENITRLFKRLSNETDCVTIFNALTFFFRSEEYLNKLLNTISQNLKVGGTFMGIVMDSDRTLDLFDPGKELRGRISGLSSEEFWDLDSFAVVPTTFKRKYRSKKYKLMSDQKEKLDSSIALIRSPTVETYSQPGWSIKSVDVDSDRTFGNEIEIHIEDSIVTDQREYLVDFGVLTQKLGEIGLELSQSEFLDYPQRLSESQNELSRLYRTFVFQRVSEGYSEVITEEVNNKDPLSVILNSGVKIGESLPQDLESLRDYLLTITEEQWESSPKLQKAREALGDYSQAEPKVTQFKNWRPLKMLPFLAEQLGVKIILKKPAGIEISGLGKNIVKINYTEEGTYTL